MVLDERKKNVKNYNHRKLTFLVNEFEYVCFAQVKKKKRNQVKTF